MPKLWVYAYGVKCEKNLTVRPKVHNIISELEVML